MKKLFLFLFICAVAMSAHLNSFAQGCGTGMVEAKLPGIIGSLVSPEISPTTWKRNGELTEYTYAYNSTTREIRLDYLKLNNAMVSYLSVPQTSLRDAILQILGNSNSILNISNPKSMYTVTILLPSCWTSSYGQRDFATVASVSPTPIYSWYQIFHPCPGSDCCRFQFDVKMVNGRIVICEKRLVYSGGICPPGGSQPCVPVCSTFDLFTVDPQACPEEEFPCRDICEGAKTYKTKYENGSGFDFEYNGQVVKLAPRFEIIECPDGSFQVIYVGTILKSGNWSTIPDKEINRFAMEYAMKNLTGTAARTKVRFKIPWLVRQGGQIKIADVNNPQCCDIQFTVDRFGDGLHIDPNIISDYCPGRTDLPHAPDFTTAFGDPCENPCFWQTNGNQNIDETQHFIGPTNGQDFIVKTLNTDNNQLMERIRVDNNRRIDFKLNSWFTTPQLSFDSDPVGGLRPHDLDIKLYRATGMPAVGGVYPAQPWWLSVNGGPNGSAFNIWTGPSALIGQENATMGKVLSILPNGNVGIGIANPQQKLVVDGMVCAKEVRVSLTGGPCAWPDYVFGKDYRLMPLEELEREISSGQHLPGIPSAAEVSRGGIEVGDMQAKLLQKVEELTLYLMEVNKENKRLRERVEKLEQGK